MQRTEAPPRSRASAREAKMKTQVLCVAVLLVLFGFAGPSPVQADEAPLDVKADIVAAVQFDHPIFVAGVVAHGGTDLSVVLMVNNKLLGTPDQIQRVEYDKGNLTAWKIVYNSLVVAPGAILTAVVTDIAGDSATKDAACGRGYVKLRQTAICK
jgi:hypothetical protein